MKDKNELIRVFAKGGILSPADLLGIMEISRKLGNDHVAFGSRQDVIFPSNGNTPENIAEACMSIDIGYEIGTDNSVYQNIISSYVAVNVVDTTTWVKEGVYQIIIDDFEYLPKLKINIVDPAQSIVPLFTGEINFIASPQEHYWFLYIRNPNQDNKLERWPRLVYSQDIAKVAQTVEETIINNPKFVVEELYMVLQGKIKVNYRKIETPLETPEPNFPYYEGINALLNNRYWLGLYWRNNQYNLDFMSAACRLCQQTGIGKISIIPWKSFIVKGIKAEDRLRWEKLMGKYGINMRHSSLELNWHLPVYDQEALDLKRFLTKELDHEDISTFGLTFSIKTHRNYYWFTSVVIERNLEKNMALEECYNILYAKDFNPNHTAYFTYAKAVKKEVIPALLIELSKLYFRQLNPEKETPAAAKTAKETESVSESYQCSNCLTIYDTSTGDPLAGVKAGTLFGQLPDNYQCPVCDSGKEFFKPLYSMVK
ncbi:MAG: rubredoxin domain-containing protein [Cyclobacteriaceae bacterium]|nr:rubredoxin domain-containing protein [Cyclobacteriaceae bacterium]